MAYWITTYCKSVSPAFNLSEFEKDFRDNDFATLAEDYDLSRSLADPSLQTLRIELEPDGMVIRFGAEDERPINVRVWTDPARVSEEIEEAEGKLPASGSKKVIQNHFGLTKSVIGIEFGISQLKNMGVVFAYEAARNIADHFDGIIRDDENNWLAVESRCFTPLR